MRICLHIPRVMACMCNNWGRGGGAGNDKRMRWFMDK